MNRFFFSIPLITATVLTLFCLSNKNALSINTPAPYAFVFDAATNTILLSKNADVKMPPASMSKLMTVYMVFERLEKGSLSLEDELPVSRKAWKKGGSKMFVRIGDRVKVSDLLRGIIVQSGNDACIVIAEALAGSEEKFAQQMTKKAQLLGLENSNFANATGWPHPEQRMSARDLAQLSFLLIDKFPKLYKLFAEKTYSFNKIKQSNRNPLLFRNVGADGLKTGHTETAGYGLTASAVRGERRIILVLNGLKSVRQRSKESLRLLEWAFRKFKPFTLFMKGEKVTEADVWLGDKSKVPLVLDKNLKLSLTKKARTKMKIKVRMKNPIAAPIKKGTQLAKLIVSAPGIHRLELPLFAGETISQLGFFGRITAAIRYVLWGPV